MPQVILRPYFLAFRNKFLRSEDHARTKKKAALLCFIALIVMLCIYFGTTMILRAVAANEEFGEIIPRKLIEVGFFLLFFLLLISDTVSTIGTFYTSEKINLVIISPKSNFRLFIAKQLEILFETGLMLIIFCAPVGLAYMNALNLGYGFIAFSGLVIFVFMFVPLFLSFIIATIFVKFSALFWKNGSLFLGAFGIAALLAFFKILSIFKSAPKAKEGEQAIVNIISLFENPNPVWFPARWASDLVVDKLSISQASQFLPFSFLGLTILVLFCLSFLVYKYCFLAVRSTSEANHKQTSKPNKHSLFRIKAAHILWLIFFGTMRLSQPLGAIVTKDLKSLIRDRAQSLQLLMYLGIVTAYITIFKFMTIAVDLTSTAQRSWWAFLLSMNVLFAGFILTALMTRLVYPSISLEGKAFYLLKASPLLLSEIVKAKFCCWLPVITLVTLSLLGSGLFAIGATSQTIIITCIMGISLSLGATGLAIGIGCWFANFEWESPNQIATGFGTLLLLLAGLALVLLTNIPAAALTWLTVVPELQNILGPVLSFASMSVCLFSVIFLNVAVARILFRKGVKMLAAQTN